MSNKAFESVELVQEALEQALRPYWEDLSLSSAEAHRFLLVGGGRQFVMTSITLIGMRTLLFTFPRTFAVQDSSTKSGVLCYASVDSCRAKYQLRGS